MSAERRVLSEAAGELGGMLSGGLLTSGSTVDSRDMPGSCRLADTDSASEAPSSCFFLYAAEPMPLSAVCPIQAGSLEPREAAMELLEGAGSGEEGSAAGRSGDRDATESGRRGLPDCGRCFQDRVPERPKAAALVAGFLGSGSSSGVGGSKAGVGV